MSIKNTIIDGKGKGNEATVDKYNALATYDSVPAIPPLGTENRRQLYSSVIEDMDVNGSSTPITFTIGSNEEYDIHILRILLVIEDSKVKEEKYGEIPALSNGVDLIIYEGTGITHIIDSGTHYSDVVTQMGGFPSDAKAKSTGAEIATVLFDAGSIIPLGIRLGRGTTDRLEFIVNDDLTGLTGHTLQVIGFKHVA